MVSMAFNSSGNAMIFTEVSIYRCSSEYRIYQHINIVRLIKGFEYVLYLSSYHYSYSEDIILIYIASLKGIFSCLFLILPRFRPSGTSRRFILKQKSHVQYPSGIKYRQENGTHNPLKVPLRTILHLPNTESMGIKFARYIVLSQPKNQTKQNTVYSVIYHSC